MTQDISIVVKHIIRDRLGVAEERVKPEASFVDLVGGRPLDMIALTRAFEDAFAIEIADEDVAKIRTVRDAIDYINEKRRGAH
jgi:acyl carrier protein